jgi:acylphosphatase
MKVRAHIFVSGIVQDVFFRSETKRKAAKDALTGWVRNLPDNRVEVVLEGEEEAVKELVEFCRRGPPGAKVTGVNVAWERYSGEFRDFQIRFGR